MGADLRAKYEVSSIILTSFMTGWGVILPHVMTFKGVRHYLKCAGRSTR